MRDITKITPKRILVCQLRQIGDVVLSTPSIILLRRKFPFAEIDVLTESKCAEVFDNNPDVSKVWAINKKELSNPFKALMFYRKVGRSRYDLIVDFQQLPRCRWVVLFSNAPVKLSYTPPWYNRFLYTNWDPKPTVGYAGGFKAGVLSPLGIEWHGEKPMIYVSEAERARGREILESFGVSENEPVITVDAAHRRYTRRWPAKYFGELLKLISQKRPDIRFYLIYGPGEKDVALEVMASAEIGNKCVMLDEHGNLREMAALIERAVLHIGNCSAPRHFAVGVDTPSLVTPGSSSSAWTFPDKKHCEVVTPGLDCHPCGSEKCARGDLSCLNDLKPEDVLPEALRMLELSENKKS
jgi:ADP-heptose:LPS heptosyltransferase